MATEFDFGRRSYDPAVSPDHGLDEVVRDWLQHLIVLKLRQEMEASATAKKAVAALLGVVDGAVRSEAGRDTAPDVRGPCAAVDRAFGPSLLPTLSDVSPSLPAFPTEAA